MSSSPDVMVPMSQVEPKAAAVVVLTLASHWNCVFPGSERQVREELSVRAPVRVLRQSEVLLADEDEEFVVSRSWPSGRWMKVGDGASVGDEIPASEVETACASREKQVTAHDVVGDAGVVAVIGPAVVLTGTVVVVRIVLVV